MRRFHTLWSSENKSRKTAHYPPSTEEKKGDEGKVSMEDFINKSSWKMKANIIIISLKKLKKQRMRTKILNPCAVCGKNGDRHPYS